MTSSLPLPRGFFDTTTTLSDDTRRNLVEFAESSIRKVLALSDSCKTSWIPVRTKKHVAVYRNFGNVRGPHAYKSNIAEVAGKHELHATLVEIAQTYNGHRNDDGRFRRLLQKLHPATLDATILFPVVAPTPDAPHRTITVQWFAVRTPTPLVADRDYCCVDIQDMVHDARGNAMLLRVLNSIELPECPPLERSHGLVRGQMLAGYIYRADPADPTLVRAHHVLRFDPSGTFPAQWSYKLAESWLVQSLVQLSHVLDKQQMTACTFVDKHAWVPNHERKTCAVCARAFGTFRLRHHCRSCGEVICGKCSVFKSVDVPGLTVHHVRLCALCRMGVQKAGAHNALSRTWTSLGMVGSGGLVDVHNASGGVHNVRGGVPNGHSKRDDASEYSTGSHTSNSTVAHNELNLLDLYFSGAMAMPSTPSGYSSTSTQSNLSIRSTASSRSVLDARARSGTASANHSAFLHFFRSQPATAAVKPQPQPQPQPQQAQPRSEVVADPTPSPLPSFRRGHRASSVRSIFSGDVCTPRARSYIANTLTLTPFRVDRITNSDPEPALAGLTTEHEGPEAPDVVVGKVVTKDVAVELGIPLDLAETFQSRASSAQLAPVDLTYLRDTIKNPSDAQVDDDNKLETITTA